MIELSLIGIGTGNPEHVTFEAQSVMRSADLIMIPRKGPEKDDLADLRHRIIAAACPQPPKIVEFDLPVRDQTLPYLQRVERWHDAIADVWKACLTANPAAQRVALLIWGDPSLYDSTLRIAGRLSDLLTVRVLPGITSLQVLTAAHRIPLNTLGAPVTITTGRQLRENGWPEGCTTLAVMLDAGGAFEVLEPGEFTIWWGAFLGMPNEILISGRLSEVAQQILTERAAARAAHGWIMDAYILRPTPMRSTLNLP